MESEKIKTRYSDAELNEFKLLLIDKITVAREELRLLASSLSTGDTGDTDSSGKTLEDGSASLEKESINQLAVRQKKFIFQLEAALIRIENKTYGICQVTGTLIPVERLKVVPHTTLCIEAKNKQT